MSELIDVWTRTRIGEVLVRCEASFNLTQLDSGDLGVDEEVAITGDVTRTTATSLRASWEKRQRYYLQETVNLALVLGVRNYRDPEQALNGYLVEGGVYINSIPGVAGNDGAVWYSGSGVPSNGEFNETVGDFAIDTDTSNVYQKVDETSWVLQLNIKGGGGAQWFTKAGVPNDDEFGEAIGDFCLNSDTSDVYEKVDADTWLLRTNIKGADGVNGRDGLDGVDGVDGVDGLPGAGIAWLGAWNNSTSYVQFDAVSFGGSSYIANFSNINKIPGVASEWDLWVSVGATGVMGATGSVSAASSLSLDELALSPSSVTGKILIYAKSDKKLYQLPDTGVESLIGSGSGSGIAADITDIWLYGGI